MTDQSLPSILFTISLVALGFILIGPRSKRGKRQSQSPHSNWNHPEKPFVDKVISSVLYFILPFKDLSKHPSYYDDSIESKKMKEAIDKMREKMVSLEENAFTSKCKEWNTFLREKEPSEFIITGTVTIPRNHEVLSLFGVPDVGKQLNHHIASTQPEEVGAEIKLELTCPASLVEKGFDLIDCPVSGIKTFNQCKLEEIKFVSSAQVILWFHGGGLVFGAARDSYGVDSAKELSKIICEGYENDTSSPPPNIVLLSVAYRLAPENPFPAAIIDGLSASSFINEHYPSLSLHVAGISAGGTLAAVIGLETLRKFNTSKQLKSIVSNIPMISPYRSNSSSYYLNSKSSFSCPVVLLRWCWSAYLQLDEKKEGLVNFESSDGIVDALKESVWSKHMNASSAMGGASSIWRFVCPLQEDLPNMVGNFPKILVLTATADPLHDEGVEFVRSLERKYGEKTGNVVHFDFKGSHALAHVLDTKTSKNFYNEWSKSFIQ